MSAEIDTTADGTVRFAGRNRRRWWGVGNQITDPYDVDKSLREAYLTFRYETSKRPVTVVRRRPGGRRWHHTQYPRIRYAAFKV